MDHGTLLDHAAFVRAIARDLVRDASTADDVSQETMLLALGHEPRRREGLRGWLASVVRNAARMRRRQESRRDRREAAAARPESFDPSLAAAERALLREVSDAVLATPEPYQTALVLRYYRGIAPKAIASALGVPLDTVKSRLRRGLEQLRQKLDARAKDGADWRLGLVALAGLRPGAAGAAASFEGALLMSTTTKTVLAAGAILVAALGALWFRSGPDADGAAGRMSARDSSPVAAPPIEPRPPVGRSRTAEIAAEPFRASEDATPAPEAAAGLEVVLGDGTPVEGARIAIVENAKIAAILVTDAAGLARTASRPVESRILVVADGCAPVDAKMRLAAGSRERIAIGEGARVAGRVTIDGLAPREPVLISLRPEGGWSAFGEADIGTDEARKIFGPRHAVTTLAAVARSDADGSFVFRGLSRSWIGTLTFPDYAIAGRQPQTRTAALDAPAEDLYFELVRLPAVSGRLVDPEGAALPGAGFMITVCGKYGHAMYGVETDDSGRFRLVLEVPRCEWVVIDARAPSGPAKKEVRLEGPFAGERDVGDIVLERPLTRSLSLSVRDRAGVAVTGAVAAASGDLISAPTDASGKTRVEVPEGATTIAVAAAGYARGTVAVPPPETDGVEAVLDACTRLRIRVRDADDAPIPDLRVRLSAAARLFDAIPVDEVYDRFARAIGQSPVSVASGGSEATWIEFVTDGQGCVRLSGLVPSLPIRLCVRDAVSAVVYEEELRLAPAEARELDVALARAARTFAVVVRGPDGQPLGGARVSPVNKEGGTQSRNTDDAGRASWKGIYSEAVHLVATKKGYAPFEEREFRIPPEGSEATVVLRPGLRVEVEAVDPSGGVLPIVGASLDMDGFSPRKGHPQADASRITFDDLPLGTARVTAFVGGRGYTIAHDTSQPVARVPVPPHGALRVVRDDVGRNDADRLVLASDNGAPAHEISLPSVPAAGEACLLPAVPAGTWQARLERFVVQDHEGRWVPRGPPVTITVTAGSTAELRFAR